MQRSDNDVSETNATVRMVGIAKRFSGNPVLEDVSIEFKPGEVHVLAGENGAGKSTLIRILGGAVERSSGEIFIGSEPVRFRTPHEALKAGIAIIHQELSLVLDMSVLDNLVLGAEPARRGFCLKEQARAEAKRLLDLIGVEIDMDSPVRGLPISLCQLIEVAKALRSAGTLIVMDEPTSALNASDALRLFQVIARLKAQGRAVVYITHKMQEIREIADRVSVLRDGRLVGTYPASELTDEGLVLLMIGDKALSVPDALAESSPGAQVLEAQGVSVQIGRRRAVSEATFSVRGGEVVGLAGLQGSGNSELLQALFGASGRIVEGTLSLLRQPHHPRDARRSIKSGIALLTNDRKGTGLVLPLSIVENVGLVALPSLSPGGWLRPRRERQAAQDLVRQLHVRSASLDMPVGSLSGGNQQKLALGKWILANPKLLLLDEPTRGIDIGAKREVYGLIEQWKAQGMGILLITSELPELLLLSDRILVMHRGAIVREFGPGEATAELVIQAAMNVEAA